MKASLQSHFLVSRWVNLNTKDKWSRVGRKGRTFPPVFFFKLYQPRYEWMVSTVLIFRMLGSVVDLKSGGKPSLLLLHGRVNLLLWISAQMWEKKWISLSIAKSREERCSCFWSLDRCGEHSPSRRPELRSVWKTNVITSCSWAH